MVRVLLACLMINSGGLGVAAAANKLPPAQISQVGNDILARMQHVDEFLKGNQWEDAVETLRRIMENQGDRLIQSPGNPQWEEAGFIRFIPVREYCQLKLASWYRRAPEALALYRRHVDPLAARWYAQAIEKNDEAKLRRVANQLLLSSRGDEALLQLGDRALERGDYSGARRWWLRIAPRLRTTVATARLLECPPGWPWWLALRGRDLEALWSDLSDVVKQTSAPVGWLAYPDTDIPLAAVWSRLVLASLLEGARDRAVLESQCLRHWHPKAEGTLAGQQGKYHELVAELLKQSEAWPAPTAPAGWTTVGGCAARNKVGSRSIDIALRPIWETALPRLPVPAGAIEAGVVRAGEGRDGLLSYHVAVVDGVVFIHQPGMLRALDLQTGKPVWPLPTSGPAGMARRGEIFAWTRQPFDVVPPGTTVAGVPRYCVTIDRGRLLARMGSAWTGREPRLGRNSPERSFLVGIDLRTQKLLFDRIFPDEPGWEFESAPLADVSHVYVSMRRRDPVSSQVRVACYAVATGRKVWQTHVARAAALGNAQVDLVHSPLSMRHGVLYYNSNLGVVAALRATNGHFLWLSQYPRAGLSEEEPDRDDRHAFRDLTPCLLHQDMAIVAPADCNRIFALDAATGHTVWTTAAETAADAVHLLGVGQGRLLAGGDSLYWIDVATGMLLGQFPGSGSPGHEFARPSPRGYGRGILAGSHVYWPTHDELFVFDQRLPRMVRQPIPLAAMRITGGNLIIDQGVLLIAMPDRLVAFNETGKPSEHGE